MDSNNAFISSASTLCWGRKGKSERSEDWTSSVKKVGRMLFLLLARKPQHLRWGGLSATFQCWQTGWKKTQFCCRDFQLSSYSSWLHKWRMTRWASMRKKILDFEINIQLWEDRTQFQDRSQLAVRVKLVCAPHKGEWTRNLSISMRTFQEEKTTKFLMLFSHYILVCLNIRNTCTKRKFFSPPLLRQKVCQP